MCLTVLFPLRNTAFVVASDGSCLFNMLSRSYLRIFKSFFVLGIGWWILLGLGRCAGFRFLRDGASSDKSKEQDSKVLDGMSTIMNCCFVWVATQNDVCEARPVCGSPEGQLESAIVFALDGRPHLELAIRIVCKVVSGAKLHRT